ncbi:MAG: radical SAM protein [Deltaproteobacteria bacterium]|nr:MAG: radical SAM protein [Deltaproteobacteria bacterium]
MLSKNITTAKKVEGIYRFLKIKAENWPRLINLEVTKLCNAQCDFCPCWEIKDYPQLKDYGPIFEKFKPIVVSLNGGEPLLRKDFVQIIDQVRPHCTYMTMITHGQLLTEDKFKEICDHGMDQVTISRNYIDEQHDQERHLPGLTKHFQTLVPHLTKQGFDNISFNTVIMDKNIDHIIPLAKQAYEWGAKISFSSYSAYKNDKEEYRVQDEKLAKLEDVIGQLLELRAKQGNIMTSEYYLKRVPEFFRKGHMEDCRAGLNFIQMTPMATSNAAAKCPS